MEDDNLRQHRGLIQSLTASATHGQSSQKLDAESAAKATKIVQSILMRFPDFGKCPPSYVVGLVELVASYPEDIQNAFADIKNGISSRCQFLPTASEFVKMASDIESLQRRWAVPSKPVRQPDTEEYNPRQIAKCFDKYGNQISEREFEERAERLEIEKYLQAKQDRLQAYARHLGAGNIEAGWQILMDRGIMDPPDDFTYPPREVTA